MSIQTLLNPKIECNSPDSNTPMPTNTKIIQATTTDSNPDTSEEPEDELKDFGDVTCTPISMTEISIAIDNIIHALNQQPQDSDELEWSSHIKALHSVELQQF
ncbi:hypothetical protein CROQUDRAFT_98503 [Cronartium quercuum f. sp. fusiforme G11]|uniref:Uncharacterized protein n=1 Tax=Cronartium quercuum f. sp. fusiforme G11 TaxID=708437 RepID=A0A9P6NDC9_9BASI|nr:hypothetical protein CROQUDRAFT_98503 [Cronartium quercuum f. sp. fusiforme G11]